MGSAYSDRVGNFNWFQTGSGGSNGLYDQCISWMYWELTPPGARQPSDFEVWTDDQLWSDPDRGIKHWGTYSSLKPRTKCHQCWSEVWGGDCN